MNRDQLTHLRPLAHPDEIELRSALGVLLQRLLADPGALFNPLYVGPLRDADLLTEEVQRAAAEAGLRMLTVNETSGRDAEQAGVALLSERDAARVARYGNRPSAGVQVVIWGRQAAETLTTSVLEWVEGGLAFEPAVDGGAHEPRPVVAAVRRLAQPGQGAPRCVVRVGPAGGDDEFITEVRLRWSLQSTAAVGEHVLPAEPGELERSTGCAILRLPGSAGVDAARRGWLQVRALLERGVAVFLATDPAGEAALRLAGLGGPAPGEAQWIRDAAADHPQEPVWPHLDAVLIGRPELKRRREGTSEISLQDTPLIEVLRGAASWQQAGTFVIFEPGRLGFIQVAAGEIRGARRVQERQEAGTAAETVARVRDIARWPNARAFFIPRDPESPEESWGTGCRLPLATVAFDLSSVGRGSSGFASFEQPVGEVASALAALGLVAEGIALLREPGRRGEMDARSHFLLGHFRTAAPASAVQSFREAVLYALERGDPATARGLALDAGLNALLLEVRAQLRTPASAWRIVRAVGGDEPAALADAPERVLVALEVAARADERPAVERLARWLIDRGAGGDLPGQLLRRYAPSADPPEPGPISETAPVEALALEAVGGAR